MYELSHIANPQARQDELRFRSSKRFDQRLLFDALSDPYPPIRHEAALTLGERLDKELIERLGELLQAPSSTIEQRRAAALALSQAPTALAGLSTKALAAASAHEDADLRYQALVALFETRADDAVLLELLPERIEDGDPEVAAVAAQICAARGFTSLTELVASRRVRLQGPMRLQLTLSVAELLCYQEEPGDEQLVAQLLEELEAAMRREETSAAAAQWLGRLARKSSKREQVAQALIKQLKRWLVHPLFKMEAAVALIELEHPEGVRYISQQLATKRKDTRGYAISVAGKYDLTQFYDEIAQVAASTDYHAETAILALAQYKRPEARQTLERLRHEHPDAECRALASQCLRDVDGSLEPLE